MTGTSVGGKVTRWWYGMKERKKSVSTGQKQIIMASCLMLILVTCLTGLYIARKTEQQNMEAELAKNNEKLSEDLEETQPLQTVDSVILPEVKEDEVEEEPKIQSREKVTQNNDMDVVEETQEENKDATPVGGSAVTVTNEAPEPVLQFSGELQWPIEGSVLMNYSMDQSVYFATLDQYKYNPAMIIGAKAGDPVAAAAAGDIVEIREDAQTGLTVVMDIGDDYTLTYGQLQDLYFKEGAHLDAGDVIGAVAEPTKYYSVEGTNLYFELEKDGKPADPTEYLPQ